MTHDELVEKMWYVCVQECGKPSRAGMAAALRVCVEEVLRDPDPEEASDTCERFRRGLANESLRLFARDRRSRYLKPKSDPAVEAVRSINVSPMQAWLEAESATLGPWRIRKDLVEQIVAAVRAADKEAHARL